MGLELKRSLGFTSGENGGVTAMILNEPRPNYALLYPNKDKTAVQSTCGWLCTPVQVLANQQTTIFLTDPASMLYHAMHVRSRALSHEK